MSKIFVIVKIIAVVVVSSYIVVRCKLLNCDAKQTMKLLHASYFSIIILTGYLILKPTEK